MFPPSHFPIKAPKYKPEPSILDKVYVSLIFPDALWPTKPPTLFPVALTIPVENASFIVPSLYPTKPPTTFAPKPDLDE